MVLVRNDEGTPECHFGGCPGRCTNQSNVSTAPRASPCGDRVQMCGNHIAALRENPNQFQSDWLELEDDTFTWTPAERKAWHSEQASKKRADKAESARAVARAATAPQPPPLAQRPIARSFVGQQRPERPSPVLPAEAAQPTRTPTDANVVAWEDWHNASCGVAGTPDDVDWLQPPSLQQVKVTCT